MGMLPIEQDGQTPREADAAPVGVRALVADVKLRRGLVAFVRGRVPAHEVDEIVQATLADAIAAKNPPETRGALWGWLRGIARHQVADYHRRARREIPVEREAGPLAIADARDE